MENARSDSEFSQKIAADESFDRLRDELIEDSAKDEKELDNAPDRTWKNYIYAVSRIDELTAKVIIRIAPIPRTVQDFLSSPDQRIAVLYPLILPDGSPRHLEVPTMEFFELFHAGGVNSDSVLVIDEEGNLLVDGSEEF
ncbi:hypothetical protein [Parasphingorhabdus pacifica]